MKVGLRQGAGLIANLFGIDPGAMNQFVAGFQQVARAKEVMDAAAKAGTSAGIGATVGALAGGATAVFAAWSIAVDMIEKAEHNAGQAQQQFMRAAGALTSFQLAARQAGVDLDELFNIKDENAFAAAFEKAKAEIEQNQRLMERFGLTWRDFSETASDFVRYTAADLIDAFKSMTKNGVSVEKLLKGMSGDLNQLIVDAVQLGKKLPAAMKDILIELVKTKNLSEEAAAALLGIGESSASFEDVREAAERYGIELDALGPKIRGLQIRDIAAQIVKDFDLLINSGADVNGVLEGMKDEVQEVITSALKLGLELPASMKPIIQAMIDAGLLTDEFGNKLTDTSRLNFAQPLTEKIDELIDAIKALIDETDRYGDEAVRHFGRARNAAEKLGQAIPRGFSASTGAPTPEDDDDEGDGSGSGTAVPRPPRNGATDEYGDAGTVQPRDEATFTTTEPVMTTMIIEIDGRTLAEAVVPQIPGVVSRYGLT